MCKALSMCRIERGSWSSCSKHSQSARSVADGFLVSLIEDDIEFLETVALNFNVHLDHTYYHKLYLCCLLLFSVVAAFRCL